MVEAIRQGDIPGVQLRCREVLPVPREEAWAWLADPQRLGRWLGGRLQGIPGEGSTVVVTGAPEGAEQAPGGARREEIRTVVWEPPGRWVAAFERKGAGWTAATRLTLELSAHPRGCELSVLQDGFQNLPLSIGLTVWEEYRRRWRGALARLASCLPDPA